MSASGLRVYRDAVAIVTGAASGIGLALSQDLARRGATVVLVDRDAEVHDVAAAVGAGAGAAVVDVTDAAAVQRLVDGVADRHGRLDFIFNNAGIGVGGEIRDHTLDAWNTIIDVNLRGVVHGVHAAYPVMLRQGFGHIVNTASMQGLMPGPLLASYSATKHAVVGLSKALRIEAAAGGVRASVLCPGVIRTPLLAGGKHGIFVGGFSEEEQRRRSASYFERLRPMPAERFVAKVLDDVARNRAIIVVPRWWKLFWWLDRLSPSLSLAMADRLVASVRRDLAASARDDVGTADAQYPSSRAYRSR